ncbi:hypothetical protein VTK26DRAFT_3989 [Humicola hyalothermophila]
MFVFGEHTHRLERQRTLRLQRSTAVISDGSCHPCTVLKVRGKPGEGRLPPSRGLTVYSGVSNSPRIGRIVVIYIVRLVNIRRQGGWEEVCRATVCPGPEVPLSPAGSGLRHWSDQRPEICQPTVRITAPMQSSVMERIWPMPDGWCHVICNFCVPRDILVEAKSGCYCDIDGWCCSRRTNGTAQSVHLFERLM